MVVAEERPRISLTQSFSKIFKDLGLSPRAVSTTFGCRVNVAVCLQVRGWREDGGLTKNTAKERTVGLFVAKLNLTESHL